MKDLKILRSLEVMGRNYNLCSLETTEGFRIALLPVGYSADDFDQFEISRSLGCFFLFDSL